MFNFFPTLEDITIISKCSMLTRDPYSQECRNSKCSNYKKSQRNSDTFQPCGITQERAMNKQRNADRNSFRRARLPFCVLVLVLWGLAKLGSMRRRQTTPIQCKSASLPIIWMQTESWIALVHGFHGLCVLLSARSSTTSFILRSVKCTEVFSPSSWVSKLNHR